MKKATAVNLKTGEVVTNSLEGELIQGELASFVDRDAAIWDRALAVIRRKLDPNWIEVRRQGGKDFNYITATKAIELLNEAFGAENWGHENLKVTNLVRGTTTKEGEDTLEYTFLAELTIKLPGRRVIGVGSGMAKWNQIDTAYKGAVSDAFKKALTSIGFFMELYPDSTDNPDVWRKQNVENGSTEKVKELLNRAGKTATVLAPEFSTNKWGVPIYYNAEQVASMHPSYIKEFIKFLEEYK